jgi:hypothetical protein
MPQAVCAIAYILFITIFYVPVTGAICWSSIG